MRKIEEMLWMDPQQAKELGRCPVCGGTVYQKGKICGRCRRDKP